ncbi:MAG: molybdenum cofactor guanylyltransferase [Planctomycetes bacterium]|nr:molybdenum cofactor guanylyltransferase [Candidatus Calescamantes bacterium]MCK5564200.1 molybdenum cofactor guanylyltransferase [Planctomycetota bacterium]
MIQRAKKNIAAVILAGGKGRRLGGVAKGKLKLVSDGSIIRHLIDQLETVGIYDIAISANDVAVYSEFNKTIIPDKRIGVGPLAGIEAGLGHFEGSFDGVIFLPCDLPNITFREIVALIESFSKGDAPAVYVQTSEFFYHPLCTVVHNDVKEALSKAIDDGQRRPLHFLQQLNARAAMFSSDEPFFNINSFADLDNWKNKSVSLERQL